MKKQLTIILTVLLILSMLSVFALPVSAASVSGTTNQYTYVRMAPYWTAETVDTLASGYSITILEREYDYLYVTYVKAE